VLRTAYAHTYTTISTHISNQARGAHMSCRTIHQRATHATTERANPSETRSDFRPSRSLRLSSGGTNATTRTSHAVGPGPNAAGMRSSRCGGSLELSSTGTGENTQLHSSLAGLRTSDACLEFRSCPVLLRLLLLHHLSLDLLCKIELCAQHAPAIVAGGLRADQVFAEWA